MTRPQIIRADSIDLQDHDTPSAKEHKHSSPGQASNGQPLAPHQAETLREVAAETKEDRRVSWTNGDIGDLHQYIDDGMQQQDALAIAQNGGSADDGQMDTDGEDDLDDDDEDDDMMDKISSSPSIEDEDIDFEFVYALHTFVATVEGQANATKGDTMVLLDDSNSYWWLVRVVKDSSIGYLPAEHIETPTERLARLNKHRNIDLAQTMLGDTPDKGKSSLKTAMRRRKKTVTFTAPTYVEASDVDYSSDEEDGMEGELVGQEQAGQQQAQAQQAATEEIVEDESAKVEPLKPRSQKQAGEIADTDEKSAEEEAAEGRASEEIFDNRNEARVRTTKNGTVRNTDSFFKDETIETKKISLTPALFRDDEANRDSNSLDSQGLRSRPSFDRLEKELVTDKQKKKEKDKKDKDKKPSGIRGLFSRSKDKKKKSDDGDDESLGKRSMEAGAEAGEDDSKSGEGESSPDKSPGPQRSTSKLQKLQRGDPSPTRKNSNARDTQAAAADAAQAMAKAKEASASLRMVESEPSDAVEIVDSTEERSKISKILHPPPKVSKAKARVELDDFDSSDDGEIVSAPEPTRSAPTPAAPQRPVLEQHPSRPILPGSYPDSYLSTAPVSAPPQQQQQQQQPPPVQAVHHMQHPSERLSESPVQVSPITSSNPPALVGDNSSQEDRSSPISSPSPELVDGSNRGHHNQDSMTSTSATGSATWNDNNLRAFFDSSSEIRDLLTVVYDKSDVAPAGPDHPVVGTLFKEQNAKLAEITSQLDNMLGDWLARKQRLRGTV